MSQKVNLVTKRTMHRGGLPGVIEIVKLHNHSSNTAAALLHLPPTIECRMLFEAYFANGMGVSEATTYHTSVLELRSDVSEVLLADGSINPKYRSVRWWYEEWRQINLRTWTGAAVLQVLEEKLEMYRETGHHVALHKDPILSYRIL